MIKNMKGHLIITFLAILFLYISGCGDGGYDTPSRLGIEETDPALIQSDVVETTDDFGTDGVVNTNDPNGTEDNNRPDPGEEITTPLTADTLKITFSNTLREGSDFGSDIRLNECIITYYNAAGQTPAYAPQKRIVLTGIVPSEGTLLLENLIIVDLDMKYGTASEWGLRNIYLYNPAIFESTLYAQIDFYGRDVLNNEPAIAVIKITIQFANYQ